MDDIKIEDSNEIMVIISLLQRVAVLEHIVITKNIVTKEDFDSIAAVVSKKFTEELNTKIAEQIAINGKIDGD